MSHQFFEPEMGLATPPAHFQQKGQKRPPWVSITALPSLVRKDEPRGGGKACPRRHFSMMRKKNPRWDTFPMEEKDMFS